MAIKILTTEEANRRVLFCNNLRFILTNGTYKKKDVARKMGITTSTLNKYTLGRVFPSEDRIQKLADVLEITVDDLFDDTYAPWKFGEHIEE
jgi:transcriptional regulator with XRE-family HTH domain